MASTPPSTLRGPGPGRRRALTCILTCILTCALICASGWLAGCRGGEQAGDGRTARDGEAAARRARAAPSGFPFRDVTAASGVGFVHDNGYAGNHHYVETMAPGVALFDADGDGDLDLYVVDGGPLPGDEDRPAPPDRFYLNRGDGTFEDATGSSGLGDTEYGMGVAVADEDGDGDLDLYVLNYGPNALYRNRGDGTFEKVEAGVEDPLWSVSGAFFDYDGDGDLDLYVANYLDYDVTKEAPCKAGDLEIYCSPEQYPPVPDRLYRNDGDGTYTDVSGQAGVARDTRGMGVATGDLDGDGDLDLYVANDRSRNLLYLTGDGGLEEVGAESGVGYSPTGQHEGGMGAAVADFTGSGRTALFLTNFQKEANRLYVEVGGGFFDDRSLPSGLGFPSTEAVGWGIGELDVEGDGDLDLVVANGHVFENAAAFIPGSAFEMADHLFLNDGSGRFELEEFPGPPLSSRGLASGDLDGDGDEDLVIAACGAPLRIWRNEAGSAARFLVLELRAAPPNTHALGALVSARVGDRTLRRQVVSGGSYASHSDTRIYLGLGETGVADEIRVRWPDGGEETLHGVAGGRRLLWRQGEGVVEEQTLGERPREGDEA